MGSVALSASAARQVQRENAAIARGLKRQDPELLDQLIETYQHRLMRYLMFLTGKRETAGATDVLKPELGPVMM